MNILVTGAIGFIAKNLIASLKNIQTGKDKTSGLTAELNIMEFTRETAPDVLQEYCASADFVFHLTTMMGTDGFTGDYESNPYYAKVSERAAAEGAQVIPVCAKLEAEIAELSGEDKAMFLEDLGIAQSGLDRLIKASYALLGYISFLTSGEDECRAWTIVKGTKAPQAAGKIHTDFERGFIRAEVVAYDDLVKCGTMTAAKEKGLVRSEGKEYVMHDGDIVLFRFNV